MSAGGEIIEGLVKVVFRQGAKRIGKMVTGAIGKKLSKDEAKEALEKLAEQKLGKATLKAKGLGKSGNKMDKYFADKPTSWTATRPKGTQQNYHVYQRNDINWNQIRTSGDKNFIGKTNIEAAAKGLPPQLSDGNFATLHHIGQDSRGPLAEASTRYHGVGKYGQDTLHSQYGKNTPNPNYPIDRKKFGVDTREYWKWREQNR